jgi:DNA-binding NtrC family response regulator
MVIPPLRQRLDDLPLLVEHFMAQSAQRQGKTIPHAPPEMLDYLRVHPFPGNVRELQALIIDAVSRHKGHKLSLQPIRDHIGDRPSVRNPNAPLDMPPDTGEFMTLQEMTEHWVTKAMNKAGGNQTLAARLLGISQPALSKRLKKMGEK